MTIQEWIATSHIPHKTATQCIGELLRLNASVDSVAYIITHGDKKLTAPQITILNDWALRIRQDEPIQYVFAQTMFHGIDLKIDSRALIPRPETAELVDLVIDDINSLYTLTLHSEPYTLTIADIGTGSGAVALSLADWATKNDHQLHIIATDISKDALDLAKKNIHHSSFVIHHPSVHIDLLPGTLLQPILEPLDLIVANLPYIPTHWLEKLGPSVKDFEPRVALDGGEDGLDLIRKLLDDAPRVLKPGGKIFLELWHEHTGADFKNFFDQYDVEIKIDSFHQNRFAILTRKDNHAFLHDS